MKVADGQLQDYARRMQDIVRRTTAINQIKQTATGMAWIVVTETVYLQLRHTLELIATALLTVNKQAISQLGEPGVRSWHALDILNAIAKVNAEFYPVPTKDGPRDEQGVIQIVEKKGDFLTREKFVTLYNACGEILHTRNPFARKPTVRLETKDDCKRLLKAANRWQNWIVRLLTHHQFKVKDDDTLYIAHTVGEDPIFHVTEFAPLPKATQSEKQLVSGN